MFLHLITGMIAFLLLVPSIAPAETFEYGWLPVVGAYRSALDGDTEVIAAGNAISGFVLINAGRGSRYWIQGQYLSLQYDGNETDIGQEVTGLEIATLYQSQFRLSRYFKPWLGIGLSLAVLDFESRYLTDNQGFLAQSLPDTQESAMNLDLNFTTGFDVFDAYKTGFVLRASIPTNDALGKIEAGFYVTF